MAKNMFVEQLKEGDRFDDLFLVKSARLSETKAGKSYLILTVMDRSGELSGPIWDNVEACHKICRAGEFIRLKGLVQAYRDKLQLKVDSVQEVDRDAVDLAGRAVARDSRHRVDHHGADRRGTRVPRPAPSLADLPEL
jgi:3'-5' exoribonuclease